MMVTCQDGCPISIDQYPALKNWTRTQLPLASPRLTRLDVGQKHTKLAYEGSYGGFCSPIAV